MQATASALRCVYFVCLEHDLEVLRVNRLRLHSRRSGRVLQHAAVLHRQVMYRAIMFCRIGHRTVDIVLYGLGILCTACIMPYKLRLHEHYCRFVACCAVPLYVGLFIMQSWVPSCRAHSPLVKSACCQAMLEDVTNSRNCLHEEMS